jgi:hypothetical protein
MRHPADQFEAFKALAGDGKEPEEIAARFRDHPYAALVWFFVHLRAQPELGPNLLESCLSWGHYYGSGPLEQTDFGIAPVPFAEGAVNV